MNLALAAIDPWFVRLNLVEGAMWIAIGIGVLSCARRVPLNLLLVMTLIAFGVSDFVETRTGGWYKPWWMLLWKTACVVTILPIVILRMVRSRSAR